jgi:alpha-N-arabinofuranosidase
VQAAAARGTDGLVHVALVNLDPHRAARVVMTLQGVEAHAVRGRILTAPAINSLNSFEKPATVRPQAFSAARVHGNQATVELPEKSVVVLDFQ